MLLLLMGLPGQFSYRASCLPFSKGTTIYSGRDTPPWSPSSAPTSKTFSPVCSNVAEGDIRCAITSLAAARGANADPDPSATLLTDRSPPLIGAPDEEMQERVRLRQQGVDKAAQEGMGTEALADLAQALLADFKGRFRTGLRVEDPLWMCRL